MPNRAEIVEQLASHGDSARRLRERAHQLRRTRLGSTVFFRGIIEISNICTKSCFYCGIRRDLHAVQRFSLGREEILTLAEWAHKNRYGSIVLQAGERSDARFVDFIEDLVVAIRATTDNQLGITLSLGEQRQETYARWFAAGAHRYLLRIETSDPALYSQLHPPDHCYERRVACLYALRELGYQVGTGVMIGLPGQNLQQLADDVRFFCELDVDMLGMGPYVHHPDTPLGQRAPDSPEQREHRLQLALNMVASCRLAMPTINIAATTALQALHPMGRELALQAGANIIMPILTPVAHRRNYQLYQGKPCLEDSSEDCKSCLEQRIRSIGDQVGYGQWGDALHARQRGAEHALEPQRSAGLPQAFHVPLDTLHLSSRSPSRERQ